MPFCGIPTIPGTTVEWVSFLALSQIGGPARYYCRLVVPPGTIADWGSHQNPNFYLRASRSIHALCLMIIIIKIIFSFKDWWAEHPFIHIPVKLKYTYFWKAISTQVYRAIALLFLTSLVLRNWLCRCQSPTATRIWPSAEEWSVGGERSVIFLT